MEPQKLSPALLQPQVTVVAILGKLLATLPRLDKEILLPVSSKCQYWIMEEFAKELQTTLYCTDDTWRSCNVTSNDDDPVTSLSRALAAYKSAPWTPRKRVTMAAIMWQGSVDVLENSWAQLARKATELRNACREAATELAYRVAAFTTQARQLQDEAARDGTAQENMVGLGQALGREEGAKVVARHEAQVRTDAMVATSAATRATMVRQRVEEALGLVEHLVAACDEATAFPQELQRLLGDIGVTLMGTNEVSRNVPRDLVAKVAVAERLWEANARLAKDHLGGAVREIIAFIVGCAPDRPSGVAEQCQRAIEDIARLLRPPECPQSVPKVSPVSMELQELSPALLQPQVTVVATLGELLATLATREAEMMRVMPTRILYHDLENFTKDLRATIKCTEDTWWQCNVTLHDKVPPSTLSQALATYKSSSWSPWFHVTMEAMHWQRSVDALVDSWVQLARKATNLRTAVREAATVAAIIMVTASARERDMKDVAVHHGTALENMVDLGLALGGEEGTEAVAGHEAQVRREPRVAASEATRATMERQWLEAALGLLERLVAACDKATTFPRELRRLFRDTEAALKGTNEASPNVPEALVAKVAEAERLWEANARLAKDHLLGAVDDILKFHFHGGLASPSACGVAERCQGAMEDIPRLLRPLERPQSVPKVSPVSVEPQELSPALLQPQVSVVAILGELLGTLPRRDEEISLIMPRGFLSWDLENFINDLRATTKCTDDTWGHCSVTLRDEVPPASLSEALAAYKSAPWTTCDHVTLAASKWQGSVAGLVNSWANLARKATNLHNSCREVASVAARVVAAATAWARCMQGEAARYGTAQENSVELGRALGREEGAEAVPGHEAWVRREAWVATSEATRVTSGRQRVEAALGLLERLVAACDEATAFPRELRRLLRNTEATLEGTNEASRDVPEELVAKVAVAERLWEANARLARDHLLGTLDDIIKFYFTGGPVSPSGCEVAERCQRAIEDIPRLFRPPERPQSVPKVSPVSMELQEVSLSQLQALVAAVATLGEVATMTGPHWGKFLHESPDSLHEDLKNFTQSFCKILEHGHVTSLGNSGVPSLSRALATLGATPGTTWANVRAMASAWWESVAKLVDSCDWLAREATKLRDTCGKVVMDQQLMVALDKEKVAREMARHDAQVAAASSEAMGGAVVATRRGHRAEVALGLLQRLVATCDKATLFNWNMECQLSDIEAILKGTNEESPDVPKALPAKVAMDEPLWVANARLAKDHLLGAHDDINNICSCDSNSSSARVVTEKCQKAIENIPNLLQGW